MAADTRQKRFSMLDFGGGAHVHALPEADGAIDQDDRQHLLGCYSGILFEEAEEPVVEEAAQTGTALPLKGKPRFVDLDEKTKKPKRRDRKKKRKLRDVPKPLPTPEEEDDAPPPNAVVAFVPQFRSDAFLPEAEPPVEEAPPPIPIDPREDEDDISVILLSGL